MKYNLRFYKADRVIDNLWEREKERSKKIFRNRWKRYYILIDFNNTDLFLMLS